LAPTAAGAAVAPPTSASASDGDATAAAAGTAAGAAARPSASSSPADAAAAAAVAAAAADGSGCDLTGGTGGSSPALPAASDESPLDSSKPVPRPTAKPEAAHIHRLSAPPTKAMATASGRPTHRGGGDPVSPAGADGVAVSGNGDGASWSAGGGRAVMAQC